MDNNLNKRQEAILHFLNQAGQAGISGIAAAVKDDFSSAAKITIIRDLGTLVRSGLIVRLGKGRSTVYSLAPHYRLVKWIDPQNYFKAEEDQRAGRKNFDFTIFPLLKNVLNAGEHKELLNLNDAYLKNIKKIPITLQAREFERLTIELSWKSSQIEGNTYTLLETERLIREHRAAAGHKKNEATMILNHKTALDYIKSRLLDFKILRRRAIEEIHELLTGGLNIARGLRKRGVGITGTTYRPLNIHYQIEEALEKTSDLVNQTSDPFEKAIIAMIMVAYIQPFEDGNKRTSRLIGNALLMAHGLCPLSYRSVDELEYKKAVILFYEQNNLSYFKKLFIDQYRFAVKNYFIP
jgi:Fic family protein